MASVDINSRPFLSFIGRYNSSTGFVSFPVVSSSNVYNSGGGAYLGQINNKYYLVPNMSGSNNSCANSSYRYKINSSTYQNYLNAYGSSISYIFPSSPSEDSMVVYPADLNNNIYEVDILHPVFLPFNSVCSTLTYVSIFPVYKTTIDVEDSGSGGSTDISPLIPAILMIPATIIVVCFFSVIYKMFINRRTRS